MKKLSIVERHRIDLLQENNPTVTAYMYIYCRTYNQHCINANFTAVIWSLGRILYNLPRTLHTNICSEFPPLQKISTHSTGGLPLNINSSIQGFKFAFILIKWILEPRSQSYTVPNVRLQCVPWVYTISYIVNGYRPLKFVLVDVS